MQWIQLSEERPDDSRTANNIAGSGDVEPTRAMRKIKSAFKGIAKGAPNGAPFPVEASQTEFRKGEIDGNIARTHIQLAFHIPEATHDDLQPLRLISTLLGEGRSSRLYQSLREKHQCVDYAQAGIFSQRDPGLFYVTLALEDRHVEVVR